MLCLRAKCAGEIQLSVSAEGEVYNQTSKFVCLGGAINGYDDVDINIKRRAQRAWSCFQRHCPEMSDYPGT